VTALDRALDSKFAEWFSLVWIVFVGLCAVLVIGTVVVFLAIAVWYGFGELIGMAVTS
jgi:hypothetical protein